jgi:hypothetical protein
MIQQELQDRNSGAKTSDWIEQAKGRAIFAYDLGILVSEHKGKTELTKEDFGQALKRASLHAKSRGSSPR